MRGPLAQRTCHLLWQCHASTHARRPPARRAGPVREPRPGAGCHCGRTGDGRRRAGRQTVGFTDVLLARDARRVYAVDVGRGQLNVRLAAQPQVVSLEATDVRHLTPAMLTEPPDAVVVDVSFISLKLVLPAALALARTPAWLVALIKPQFEAGRARVKRGIVRDPQIHAAVCEDIAAVVAGLGWAVAGLLPSPITGGDGNREFLIG